MRAFGVVFTLSVAHKRNAIACKRNTLICKKNTHHVDVCDHEEDCHHADVFLRKKSLLLAECRTTSSLSLGRCTPNLRRARQMVGLVAIELVLQDSGELGQILEKKKNVDNLSWLPHDLFFDSWVRLVLNC